MPRETRGVAQVLVLLPEPVRRELGQAAEARLALAHRRLGLAPRHELADLAAHAHRDLQQPGVGLARVAAEELDRAQDLVAHHHRAARRRRAGPPRARAAARWKSAWRETSSTHTEVPGGEHPADEAGLAGHEGGGAAHLEEACGSSGRRRSRSRCSAGGCRARPALQRAPHAQSSRSHITWMIPRIASCSDSRAAEEAGHGVLDRLALLGPLALGDVDDGADQARHLAVGAREGRLVVHGVALRRRRA